MDTSTHFTLVVSGEQPAVSPRVVAAEACEQFERLDSPWISSSKIARVLGVADSTLRYWVRSRRRRLRNSQWPPNTVRFLEGPEGLEVLRRLLAAAHLIFLQSNDCGIRDLCLFLEFSGLDEFIASSYGAQQSLAQQMEALLIAFGQEEHQRLAASMPPRVISVALDETFHPQICLVGIEPVSNFLLLESYQPRRDAATWNQSLGAELATLPVIVCQVVSDQAKALLNYAQTSLGAHHSPDLFHVHQDVSQAMSLALTGQTRRAKEEQTKAQAGVAKLDEQLAACREQCPESSLCAELEQQSQQARVAEAAAKEHLAACQDRQHRARHARKGLSHDHHPVDLENGQPLSAEEVGRRLAERFDTLEQIAAEAVWTMIGILFRLWDLPEAIQQWMRQDLIPGLYLALAAEKVSGTVQRQRLRDLSQEILVRARSPDGLWGTLSPEMQVDLEQKTQLCADLFQRSSSCVEGRNGQLSLKHHALHRFTLRKLQALKVLHNYLARRPDGTTAAERFYGAPSRDLFAWLLDHIAIPSRPRSRRRAA